MKKEIAAEVARLAREASGVVDLSVATVGGLCSEKAGGLYRSAVGHAMAEMAFNLLFPIWRQHPDLEPDSMKGPSTFDPREFRMPAAAAKEALEALSKARALMDEVRARLEQEPDHQERQAYLNGLAKVFGQIASAVDGVEKRRE
jgi:hypothetical protein